MLELRKPSTGNCVSDEDLSQSLLKPKLRWLVSPAAFVRLAILIGICPILGFFGKAHWFLDLFNHLQAQYFVSLLLIVLVLAAWKKWKHASIAVIVMMIPISQLSPLYESPKISKHGPTLRVATFNVLGSNTRYSDTIAWIKEVDPDFIYLPECNARWQHALKPLDSSYPFNADKAVSGNLGYCFRSKYPIISTDIPRLGKLDIPLLQCVVRTPNGDVTVFGAHPVPPVSEFWANEQDIYLKELTRRCASTEPHALILGDLNATRWSTQLDDIFNHYEDSADGHGYSATWMRENWFVTIPIDHILTRGFNGVINRETGPELGSDHRPVISELAW
jgi:endonuclease/exonuclease/phosphatase (EEP) superfamily protein YafD